MCIVIRVRFDLNYLGDLASFSVILYSMLSGTRTTEHKSYFSTRKTNKKIQNVHLIQHELEDLWAAFQNND